MAWLFWCVIGSTAFSGCASQSTDPVVVDLASARAAWAQQGPADYRIDVRRLCFCGYDVTRAVRVTVRNSVIVERTYADDGSLVSANPEFFPDVPGLFAVIEDAIARDAHRIDVAYDPDLGFPRTIAIDYIEQAVDEELTFQADNFSVLSGQD